MHVLSTTQLSVILPTVPEILDNPRSVAWSHSDSTADFYELPTDGDAMHEALTWLLPHYHGVKLWMGCESADGTELYLTCSPSRKADVVNRLHVYEDQLNLFDSAVSAPAAAGS